MKRFIFGFLLLCLTAVGADAANCFWVGGTASVTPVNILSWASASGGTPGTCAGAGNVPGSADVATFDASSGGGTVTMNFGGTWTLTSLVMGAFTGTFDNSVNNNNITFSGSASTPFNASGTGTRTIKLGTATYSIGVPGGGATWNVSTVTNLTMQAASATITWTGATGNRTFAGGGQSYGTMNLPALGGGVIGVYNFSGNNTFGTFNLTAPNNLVLTSLSSTTITNAFSWAGSTSNSIGLIAGTVGAQGTIVATGGGTISNAAFRDMAFTTGTVTATNSLNLGNNTGVAISGPSAGGGGCILGGWLLWRDMPGHLNDNFPAWLDKAA